MPLRTAPLIVTVLGDAIVPRGGEVWLGSMIRALQPFGLSERVVRTAVFRLVQQGMVGNEQVGRRSYYTLTRSGRRDFAQATRRIYRAEHTPWEGRWCLLLLSALSSEERQQVRRALKWFGFGAFGNEMLAHPRPEHLALNATLTDLPGADRIIQMQSDTLLAERNSDGTGVNQRGLAAAGSGSGLPAVRDHF